VLSPKPHGYVVNCIKTLTNPPSYAIASDHLRKQLYGSQINQMKPSNKMLGLCGMVAAPFLTFQLLAGQAADAYNTSLGGFFDLVYMVGWMCSIVGLMRLQAAGFRKNSQLLFYIQLAFLCVANVWNIWVIIDPTNNSTFFYILDLFWPLSNVFMLVIGIVIAVKGVLKGWRRYVVLIVGLWLPAALGFSFLLGREHAYAYYPGAAYSVFAWALLGWMIFTSKHGKESTPALVLQ